MEKSKKSDLLSLWRVLEALKTKKVNVNFSYFIAKNKIAIKDEIEALQEAQIPSELFKLYDEKRAALAERMADRVEGTANPVTKNGQYIITERMGEFEETLSKLKDDFGQAIEERHIQIENFKKLLDEEIEFDGHPIKLKNLPGDIEPSVLEVLLRVGLIIEE